MKILHLMQKEKFTAQISSLYDSRFNDGTHEICYLSKDSNYKINLANIKTYSFNTSKKEFDRTRFVKFIDSYDYIVLHSFFLDNFVKALLIIKRLYKKLVWIEWGYDLYNWIPTGKFRLFTKQINRFLRNNLLAVVCIFEPDVETFKKLFPKSKSKVFYAPYCGPTVDSELLEYSPFSRLKKTLECNDPVYVQVGHSANKQIDHLLTLRRLERFKNDNIKIFLPLSYGDKEYANTVKATARSLFDDEKLIIVDEFLERAEYFDILRRIDIAIFETDRQIALGNIHRLTFRNTKLFLKRGSVMFNYFAEHGVPVCATEELDNCSFNEFVQIVHSNRPDLFRDYIASLSDIEKKIDYWKEVFAFLKNKWTDDNN